MRQKCNKNRGVPRVPDTLPNTCFCLLETHVNAYHVFCKRDHKHLHRKAGLGACNGHSIKKKQRAQKRRSAEESSPSPEVEWDILQHAEMLGLDMSMPYKRLCKNFEKAKMRVAKGKSGVPLAQQNGERKSVELKFIIVANFGTWTVH